MSKLLEAALAYRKAGRDVIPDHPTEKYPVGFKGWEEKNFTEAELSDCILNKGWGIGLRNQEGLDFDNHGSPSAEEAIEKWKKLVDAVCPELVDRLLIEKTQHGGFHVAWECEEIEGNQKLAGRLPTKDELQKDPDLKSITFIETRGTGGQFVVSPTPGYILLQRDWCNLPQITPEERKTLLQCARALDLIPTIFKRPTLFKEPTGGFSELNDERPGTKFNSEGIDEALELLKQKGWEEVYQQGDTVYLRRPGKDKGISATFGYIAPGVFYNFSANGAPFEPNKAYTPFAIFSLLKHNGNFSSAASELAERYGINFNVYDFPRSGTETPQGIEKSKLLEQPLTYAEVEEKVQQFIPNSQTALKLVLAVAVSSSFLNPLMLWLLLVGVPSSGKTDIVRLPKDVPTSYYLDNLTQNSFISGERPTKSNKVYDLLPLLDKKCFIVKDWTSIFSLDEKMTKKILGDLVGIYDKEFAKFSSRRGNITYKSAFSQLGCITPATLNKHAHYLNMVGPRFLCYTMPSSTQESEDLSYELIFSEQDRAQLEKEARLYTSSYLDQLTKKSFNVKPLDKNAKAYLKIATGLMSKCRGIVILQSATFKNEKGEDVTYSEVSDIQVEEPWRAIQQLMTLAKYLAFVVGKDEVGTEELTIIKDVVLSSMPADRARALKAIQNSDGQITAKQLSESSDKSTKTSRRLLDELTALKVLHKIPGLGTTANDYQINEQFRDFLLLDPTEFMSRKEDSGTESPHSVHAEDDTEGDFIASLRKDEPQGDEK